uniref:DAGKc domain-containing protein n=1 Tax=Setaria viridis TaxID=4556 RepID=A0A4V6Y8F8_SETVI|nr:hypothetical protein SEVIR_5G442100v2 [Setaria viridis]
MAAPATPRASLILPRASSHSHSQPRAGGLTSDRVAASHRRRGAFVFVVNPSDLVICECFTSGPSHAIDVTREAIKDGADAVIAVGGDGTLHELVNDLFWKGSPVRALDRGPDHSTTLGLIPLGTGSDFARTFDWTNDPHDAIDRIVRGVKSKLDIGVMEGPNREPHFFVNVADIHLSAKAEYFASMYKRFGNLCYVFGALRAFWGHNNRDMRIKVSFDHE